MGFWVVVVLATVTPLASRRGAGAGLLPPQADNNRVSNSAAKPAGRKQEQEARMSNTLGKIYINKGG